MKVQGMGYREAWEMALRVYGRDVKRHAVILEALSGEFGEDGEKLIPPTLYRFGKEFAEELSLVELPTIPLNQLPPKFEGCFEFLDNWIWVRLDQTKRVRTSDGLSWGEGTFAAFSVHKSGNDDYFGTPIGGDFSTVDSILEGLEAFLTDQAPRDQSDQTKLKWAINALVYVATGAPDLRDYQPPPKDSPLTRREKDRLVQENGADPCVLVSWGWKKPRRQVASSWEVSGHFWWAPVGEGRSRRELRWREGHTKAHKA